MRLMTTSVADCVSYWRLLKDFWEEPGDEVWVPGPYLQPIAETAG